jgi:DNA-binding CsgD family transcriptional regulator
MSQYTPRHLSDPSMLTAAEITFLRELAAGARDLQDAATRLGMTYRSAQRRSGLICQKLGAANWRDAVAMGREQAA